MNGLSFRVHDKEEKQKYTMQVNIIWIPAMQYVWYAAFLSLLILITTAT